MVRGVNIHPVILTLVLQSLGKGRLLFGIWCLEGLFCKMLATSWKIDCSIARRLVFGSYLCILFAKTHTSKITELRKNLISKKNVLIELSLFKFEFKKHQSGVIGMVVQSWVFLRFSNKLLNRRKTPKNGSIFSQSKAWPSFTTSGIRWKNSGFSVEINKIEIYKLNDPIHNKIIDVMCFFKAVPSLAFRGNNFSGSLFCNTSDRKKCWNSMWRLTESSKPNTGHSQNQMFSVFIAFFKSV